MGARKGASRPEQGGEREMGEMSETSETGKPEGATVTTRIGFAPIVRLDEARREIELCATSEAVDSHGTIFDYDASRDAFTRWIGNVREMHSRQAVGSRVAVRCDDETRRVYVRIRISRGAQDTWEKVLDGTLRGASIGASGVVWQRQRRRVAGAQRWLNVATRYDLAELSLVDNPSNPDALGISFVRDATPDVALLDVLDDADVADEVEAVNAPNLSDEPDVAQDEHAFEPETEMETVTRGDAHSEAASSQRLHGAARMVLLGCGCSTCAAARALLEDVRPLVERGTQAEDQPIARALAAGLTDHGVRLVALDAGVRALAATIEAALQRMADAVGGMGARIAALENQPLAGGPVARPMEKTSALEARGLADVPARETQCRALESLAGEVRDPQVQVAIAAEIIRLRQGG